MKQRLISLLLIVFTGCATLFGGGSAVPIATNPPGAFVYVNGMPAGQTPTVVQLDPDRPAQLQIYLPGYQPVQLYRQKAFSGWFWVNILFWPGFLVDLATGAYQKYDGNPIAIGLVPAQGAPPPDWYQQQPQNPQQPMPPQPYPAQPPAPGPIQPGGPAK